LEKLEVFERDLEMNPALCHWRTLKTRAKPRQYISGRLARRGPLQSGTCWRLTCVPEFVRTSDKGARSQGKHKQPDHIGKRDVRSARKCGPQEDPCGNGRMNERIGRL
jgi:hypothetical protein